MGPAGIKLATPGSAVRMASVARHVTDCAKWPSLRQLFFANLLAYIKYICHICVILKKNNIYYYTPAMTIVYFGQ